MIGITVTTVKIDRNKALRIMNKSTLNRKHDSHWKCIVIHDRGKLSSSPWFNPFSITLNDHLMNKGETVVITKVQS